MEFSSKITFPEFEQGSVWLVGAGPGDPKLLTLYAYHGLHSCDAVVYDSLVSSEIMNLIPDHVELIKMGKRGGVASPKQYQINERLLELARAGKKVVRLKGGDPFVFGRGAEEAMAILEENIPVRIIPAISAGMGGAAYGGVPVTEGSRNYVISFVTGHGPNGDLPNINWQALSDSSPVIVFYMAMSRMGEIRDLLIKAGRRENDPVFFISNATTPEQATLDSTLKNCLHDCEKNDIRSPALMVIGPTLELRPILKACF